MDSRNRQTASSKGPDRRKSAFQHETADESPGFLFYKMSVLWQQKLAAIFQGFGITQTQYAILASVKYFEERGESVSQARLVEHAKIEKMTVSKAIRQLEEDGLLSRKASKEDARAVRVRFTASGERLIQKAVKAVEKADDEFFGVLDGRDLEQLKTLMIETIERNADGGAV